MRSSYLGHIFANRKLLSQSESETYQSLRGHSTASTEKNTSEKDDEQDASDALDINPECARVNLWPLIQEGKENHPFLYDMTMKMLDHFYGNTVFRGQNKTAFLNAFLKKAKESIQKKQFCLEKLAFDSSLQLTYYKLQKEGPRDKGAG